MNRGREITQALLQRLSTEKTAAAHEDSVPTEYVEKLAQAVEAEAMRLAASEQSPVKTASAGYSSEKAAALVEKAFVENGLLHTGPVALDSIVKAASNEKPATSTVSFEDELRAAVAEPSPTKQASEEGEEDQSVGALIDAALGLGSGDAENSAYDETDFEQAMRASLKGGA